MSFEFYRRVSVINDGGHKKRAHPTKSGQAGRKQEGKV